MNKKWWLLTVLIIGVILLTLAGMWLWHYDHQPKPYTGPVEELRIGVSKNAPQLSSLIYVAQSKGYFSENKLQITTTVDPNSTASRKNVSDGVEDLGTSSDFGLVGDSFTVKNLRIVTVISSSKLTEIIGRKDKGIVSPADLKGKKIALTPKSSGEFFFGAFLRYNNLKLTDVVIVPTDLDKVQGVIVAGNADVAVTNDPFAYQIKQALGDNAIPLPSQPGRDNTLLLISSAKTVQSKPAPIERFVAALIKAQDFITKNPEESKTIIKDQFKLDTVFLDQNWPKNLFTVSLDQSLVLGMEDQARWLIDNKLTTGTVVPNYVDFIYFDALLKLKPQAVTIIH